MFVTEAVTGGLPVHIAARILGHKSLITAQAYLAVFQDDLVRTYRAFLDRRRADRPIEEYREPTDQEWRDFQRHFELRKVSLGTCGRPCGNPCKHEHACIRAPSCRLIPASGRARDILDLDGFHPRVQDVVLNTAGARELIDDLVEYALLPAGPKTIALGCAGGVTGHAGLWNSQPSAFAAARSSTFTPIYPAS